MSQSERELRPMTLPPARGPCFATRRARRTATSLSKVVYWITGLITRMRAGPIPLHRPLMPSVLMMDLAASTAESLTFLVGALPGSSAAATAWVDWAVWIVHIGFVARVVIVPESQHRGSNQIVQSH